MHSGQYWFNLVTLRGHNPSERLGCRTLLILLSPFYFYIEWPGFSYEKLLMNEAMQGDPPGAVYCVLPSRIMPDLSIDPRRLPVFLMSQNTPLASPCRWRPHVGHRTSAGLRPSFVESGPRNIRPRSGSLGMTLATSSLTPLRLSLRRCTPGCCQSVP